MDSATSARWPSVHPYLLLIFVALFWAGNVVLGRGVSGIIPPVTLNVFRWAIALAVLLPLAWPQLAGKGQVIRQHLPELVLLAIPSIAIYNTFIYIGTRTTTAANAGLIVGTMPIVILVLASLAGEERLTTRRAAGIAVSFAGVVFVIAKVLYRPFTSCRSRSEIFSSSGRLSPGPSTPSCCGALPFRWARSLCSRCCRQSGSHYASRSAPGSFCTANTSYGRPKRWQPSSTSASFPRW